MTTQSNKEKNYIVSQSNRLIEADYSKSNLPARTLKVGRLIVSKVSPDDKNFRLISIKNNAIRQYLGYKSNVPYNRFSTDLENICKQLNEEPIKIRTERDTILNAFLISSWEINHKEDTTVFEISGRLKEYLLALKRNYTTYQLQNLPRLNSSYSIRMYELLTQYRKIGKRKFELEDLKRKIGCSYNLYGHFKSKALLRAQKDLEKFTDIRFEFEEIKKGRKITQLLFFIYPNNPDENSEQGVLSFLDEAIEVENTPKIADNIKARLTNFGISPESISRLIRKGFNIIEDEQTRLNAIKRCKTLDFYFFREDYIVRAV